MARLTIKIMGELVALINEVPISTFESDKVRALLVYLVVETGRAHRRDALIGLLWPDYPEQTARHNLSQALFNLRLALGDHTAQPPYLLISRDAIQFNQESDYYLDFQQFNDQFALVEESLNRKDFASVTLLTQLEALTQLNRGEFLQQFFLGESPEFEEWILTQREILHQRLMNSLSILINQYEQQADYAAARRFALGQLELDPWREEAHYRVMRLYALDGQRSAALAQYENCRKVLAEELGVEPSTQTRELYDQIRLDTVMDKPEAADQLSAPLHSLPVSITPFVGREQELADLARLIAEPECRCITLTGPGGIGKTRLALETAEQHSSEFLHGSAFIPLSSVSTLDAVIPTIANSIDYSFYGPADPKIQLYKYLHDKQLLLIIDNVEHLLAGAEQDTIANLLIEILQAASQVKLLVTSREVLNFQGEWSFEVPGLTYPGIDQMNGFDRYSAVRLFVQRARRARPGFEMTDEDKPGILRLCQLVEGMPLALELAAAWVRILSPAEIIIEIENSLDFLNAQVRDLPERHRSMQAVFDHSWHMLTEEERQVLLKVSVFHGGFTREAAEAVAGSKLALLSTLVAKSFLRRTVEGRYTIHELIRQYVADHLAEVPQEELKVRDSHSAYFMDYVARQEDKFKSAQQLQARDALDADIDNIRTGWRWAVRRGLVAAVRAPIRSLWCFYDMRGWFQEAEASFAWATDEIDKALLPGDDADGGMRALREYLRALLGWFFLRRGKIEKAELLLQSSLASLRTFDPGIELVDVLYYAATIAWMSGDYPRARALWLEELSMAEQLGSQWDVGLASLGMGVITGTIGEYEEAQVHMQRALAIYRKLGDRRGIAWIIHFSSILKHTLGTPAEAQVSLRECLALSESVGDRVTYGMALSQLGLVTQALGDHAEAVVLLNESLVMLREIGEFWSLQHALTGLGAATLSTGDYSSSRAAYYEALKMAWERQALPEVLEAMTGMAVLLAQQGALVQALVSAFFVLNHPSATEQAKEAARQLQMELESSLSPDEVEAAQQLAGSQGLDKLVHQFID